MHVHIYIYYIDKNTYSVLYAVFQQNDHRSEHTRLWFQPYRGRDARVGDFQNEISQSGDALDEGRDGERNYIL